MGKKMALGRGLGALISDADTSGSFRQQMPSQSSINEIDITYISANPNQPRTKFDDESLLELAESIRHLGIIQPITLRKISENNYQIISGERRFRAAKLVDMPSLPAYVREVNDDEVLTMALVENVQREDLDAMEIAISYQRLLDECHLTQEDLSERVGKKRSTVANYLRLLSLPPEIQLGIINSDISMGHARAIIGLENQDDMMKVFTEVIENDFSVRKTEERIREMKSNEVFVAPDAQPSEKKQIAEEYVQLRTQIADKFRSPIKFKINEKGKGEITIPFTSAEDLERIVGIFDKINN